MRPAFTIFVVIMAIGLFMTCLFLACNEKNVAETPQPEPEPEPTPVAVPEWTWHLENFNWSSDQANLDEAIRMLKELDRNKAMLDELRKPKAGFGIVVITPAQYHQLLIEYYDARVSILHYTYNLSQNVRWTQDVAVPMPPETE